MKRFLASLLVFILAITPVAATTLPLTGAGVGGPTATPVSNACINSSGTTITFTAQGVGGANASRVTVVTIAWDDSTLAGTSELTAMTVGGISMTRAVRAVGDNQNSNSEIWFAANPTGTTANIVATFSTAVDGITIEVYSLIGYDSVSATTTGTTSVTQAYDNKQLALAVGSRRTNVSTSLSNMRNDFSSACGANLWGVHASQALHGNGGSLTSTISPTGNTPLIALAKWSVSTGCAQSATFLARTSGLDTTHIAAYKNLICGLVTDNLYSGLDMLHIYAAQDSTTAKLNLISTSYPATLNNSGGGPVTFTVDRGFTGVSTGGTYIGTAFNPTTASSPNYTQNSGHVSILALNAITNPNGAFIMGATNGGTVQIGGHARFGDGNAYFELNNAPTGVSVAVASTAYHYMPNRTTSTALQGYGNGVSLVSSNAITSVAPPNLEIVVLGQNKGGGTIDGAVYQAVMASIGKGWNGTEALNFYNRLRTYMTAVGVP